MRLSIYSRLLLPIALFVAVTVGITVWAAKTAARTAEERIEAQLNAIATTVSEPPSFPLTSRVLGQMRGLSGAEFVFSDRNGTITATRTENPPTIDTTTTESIVTWAGRDYRKRSVPLKIPPNDGSTLHIFYPEDLRQEAVRAAYRPFIWLGASTLILGLALAALVARWLFSRVNSLRKLTERISTGNFAPAPLPRTEDELTDLTTAMNSMASRLAQTEKDLKQAERLGVIGQFAGGLAHQIRNAALGAKLALELQADGQDAEAMTVAKVQLERIEHTVKQFLTLGTPRLIPKVATDLQPLVAQAIRMHQPACQHLGVTFTWQPPVLPALAHMEPDEILHVLSNLISNAIDAAGPGGTVTVKGFSLVHQLWSCEIIDTGPGPPSDLALFTPFACAKPGGIGLGLVVVREILQTYGGQISWSRQESTTVFLVTLPRPS